jgi:hypothetical protein
MAETIGFIGHGATGAGMAGNLINAGYTLVVNDICQRGSHGLARGAKAATSPADVACQSNNNLPFAWSQSPCSANSVLMTAKSVEG